MRCISTGVILSDEAIIDMCDAKEKENQHTSSLLLKDLRKDQYLFFSTVPNLKLKSFKKKIVKMKTSAGKEIILKADKNLFSSMTIVAQLRQPDMKEVFSHPVGPARWSLSTADGCLRKTNMASLPKYLE